MLRIAGKFTYGLLNQSYGMQATRQVLTASFPFSRYFSIIGRSIAARESKMFDLGDKDVKILPNSQVVVFDPKEVRVRVYEPQGKTAIFVDTNVDGEKGPKFHYPHYFNKDFN